MNKYPSDKHRLIDERLHNSTNDSMNENTTYKDVFLAVLFVLIGFAFLYWITYISLKIQLPNLCKSL